MMKWFYNIIDNIIFKRLIKCDFHLNQKDVDYLQKIGKANPDLLDALEKIAAAQVITAMSAKTVEGLIRRNAWIECIGCIKGLMTEQKKKEKHDRIRNKRMES